MLNVKKFLKALKYSLNYRKFIAGIQITSLRKLSYVLDLIINVKKFQKALKHSLN